MDDNDHRRLGESLDLFHFEDQVPGVAFWHPRGSAMLAALRSWLRAGLLGAGWTEIETPQLMPLEVWKQSGHLDFYGKGMFAVEAASGEEDPARFALKPMNCPGAAAVYRHGSRSWRDLPLRLAEFGRCHRKEPSGAMHGLLRLRAFEQDDGHAFCAPDQVAGEIAAFCSMVDRAYRGLGFDGFEVAMSLRPALRAGSDADWDRSEALLEDAARQAGLQPRPVPGEGAFYGPKLEFSLRDRAGRSWQCGTIQLDVILPARMGLHYVDLDGQHRVPVLLHRAALGSLERMLGILLEHHGAVLPPWLAPEQVAIFPVGEKHAERASQVAAELRSSGVRVRFRPSEQGHTPRLGSRIKPALLLAVPGIVVIGDKELESGLVTLEMGGDKQALTVGEVANLQAWRAPPL